MNKKENQAIKNYLLTINYDVEIKNYLLTINYVVE